MGSRMMMMEEKKAGGIGGGRKVISFLTLTHYASPGN